MAESQNFLSQIGNLLGNVSSRSHSPPLKSSGSSDRNSRKDKTVGSDLPKSRYSTDMAENRFRSYSPHYQEWNDKNSYREDKSKYIAVDAHGKSDRYRSPSRASSRRRSVNSVKNRLPQSGHHNQPLSRRHDIDPEPPYSMPKLAVPRDHERGRPRSSGPSLHTEEALTRPRYMRRPSSMNNLDHIPHQRKEELEQYGSPNDYYSSSMSRPARQYSRPRRHRIDSYHDYDLCEPYFSDDEGYQSHPERYRARGLSKTRRSRSRFSRRESSLNGSSRSASSSSSIPSSATDSSIQSTFPKRGKTIMPAKIIDTRAIVDLGYPFEQEGDYITIMKALGRDNIDELLYISEEFRAAERSRMEKVRQYNGFFSAAPTSHYSRSKSPGVRTSIIPPPPVPVTSYAPVSLPEAVALSNMGVSHLSSMNSGKMSSLNENVSRPKTPCTTEIRDLYAEIKILEAEKESLRAQLLASQLRQEIQGKSSSQKPDDRESHPKEMKVHRDGKTHKHKKSEQNKKDRKSKKH